MSTIKRSDEEIVAALERWLGRAPHPDEKSIRLGKKLFSPRDIVEGAKKWVKFRTESGGEKPDNQDPLFDSWTIYNMYVANHRRLAEAREADPVGEIDAAYSGK